MRTAEKRFFLIISLASFFVGFCFTSSSFLLFVAEHVHFLEFTIIEIVKNGGQSTLSFVLMIAGIVFFFIDYFKFTIYDFEGQNFDLEKQDDDLNIDSVTYFTLCSTRRRLFSELLKTRKNGQANLVLGIIANLAAVIFLITNYEKPPPYDDYADYYFFSRFSITLILEVIGIFFLNLYRKNLQEIKFYHNEITNIDHHLLVLLNAGNNEDNMYELLLVNDRNRTN